MAPIAEVIELAKRQIYCSSGYVYSDGTCGSSWYWWGRWVFLGVVVVAFILLMLACGCFNTRRRRRQGLQPRYGMGWMAPPKYSQNNPNAYAPPPPQYSQYPQTEVQGQYTGTTFNPQDGYYGNVQQPPHTYQRGTGGDAYEAPAGPPPGPKPL